METMRTAIMHFQFANKPSSLRAFMMKTRLEKKKEVKQECENLAVLSG
jgi:hypothetical protein